jgi:hypothetical protein
MIILALFKIIQMSNKLIIMSKGRTINRLYAEGVSKQSIGERTGLPRNSAKKYIRLFLASCKSLEEIEQMSDTDLEQMFLKMAPRHHIEDDPRYQTRLEFFPVMEKALKNRGVAKEKIWQQYITQHQDGYRILQFKHYFLLRKKVCNPVMYIEHKTGEKMYVFFCSLGFRIF